MKIIFTGDLFTGGQLVETDLYKEYKIEIDSFLQSDLRICNLEQATSDTEFTENKSTIHAPLNSLDFLKQNKIDVVCLANNHIQDKGESGFLDMLDYLDKNNICYFGAGRNIKEASRPLLLENSIALLGYCDNNKPYLKKIQVASEKEYGVNPLSKKKIFEDLETIDHQAILYFHWGKENVWFPPYENIQLAKDILEHPKVKAIIGMHSHRIQGKLKHKGKYCYFSLGNFLFPEFYLQPRTQIYYPENNNNYKTTYEYHPVLGITKKKWKYSNRISLVIQYNENKFEEIFVKQNKETTVLNRAGKIEEFMIKKWFLFLSLFYQDSTKNCYLFISFVFNKVDNISKYIRISIYLFLKNNPFKSFKFLFNEFRK